MTYSQVKQAWLDDSFDLVFATLPQLHKLADELDNSYVYSRYADFKDELNEMRKEA
jgi:hypothetical protein